VVGGQLDWMILEVFSNLGDSIILGFWSWIWSWVFIWTLALGWLLSVFSIYKFLPTHMRVCHAHRALVWCHTYNMTLVALTFPNYFLAASILPCSNVTGGRCGLTCRRDLGASFLSMAVVPHEGNAQALLWCPKAELHPLFLKPAVLPPPFPLKVLLALRWNSFTCNRRKKNK